MKCSCCGKEIENVINGEDVGYVCSDCLERYFTSCEFCGVWVHNDDICTVNSEGYEVYVCEKCCDNSYS